MEIVQQIILDPASYAFMQRALLTAILIGISSGVIGTYVVTRGMAFLGDALAHTILPGVAIAFLVTNGQSNALLIGGLISGVLSAFGIGFLTRGQRLTDDTAIGVVFAAMLALGIGIISAADNYTTDLSHVLIGNILAVSVDELNVIALVTAIVLMLVIALYKEFLVISFDPTLAQTLRLPAETLRMALLVLLSLTIVIGVQGVGVALVAALLVTPAATALFFTYRLHHTMILAALLGASGGVVGMYIAYHSGIAPSAAIVLTMSACFLIGFFFAPNKGWVWSLVRRTATPM